MSERIRVLIHARGRFTEDECEFWRRLHKALNDRAADLWLMAHHDPATPLASPHARVSNGLDSAADRAEQIGEDACASVAALAADGLDAPALLERERQWRGHERDDTQRSLRLRALRVYQRLYAGALASCRPHVVMVWNGEHPQEIVLRTLAARTRAHVCVLERGPFAGTIHPDDRGILGASSAALRTAWAWKTNQEADRWRNVFDALRERLLTQCSTWWGQPESVGAHALRRRLGVGHDESVALFAGQVDADAQNFLFANRYRDNKDAFDAFLDAFRASGQRAFVLGKHHPRSATGPEEFQRLLNGVRGRWLGEISIQDCLGLCDRVVAVNSTVLFEALLLEKPCLMLGSGLLSGSLIAYEPDGRIDAKCINRWVGATDHRARMARFRQMSAHLLGHDLYTMRKEDEAIGVRGVSDLATWLTRRAEGVAPVSPRGVTFVDPWQTNAVSSLATPSIGASRAVATESVA